MIKSMTGYGRAQTLTGGKEIVVEIKSVNHRYFDFNLRIPRVYGYIEDNLKALLQEHISRGKIDVFINVKVVDDDDTEVVLNRSLLKGYLHAIDQMSEEFGLKNDTSVSTISRFNELFHIQKKEDDQEEMWKAIRAVALLAVQDFLKMRTHEGARLFADLSSRCDTIQDFIGQIEERAPQLLTEYRNKIGAKMSDLLSSVAIDENRLLTEAAYYAERSAVTEELVRMHSHLSQFRSLIKDNSGTGRKLDFLVQEMNREINTIGSKSNDLYITKIVVELKSEIEKVREQIQNVE